jgi:uncharacterized membrane protein YeaQ/YmgE (transglycosylase-associated protein family)
MRTNDNQGVGTDIIMGIIGALVGGFIVSLFGQEGVSGFNLYSLIVAVIGAMLVTWIAKAVRA